MPNAKRNLIQISMLFLSYASALYSSIVIPYTLTFSTSLRHSYSALSSLYLIEITYLIWTKELSVSLATLAVVLSSFPVFYLPPYFQLVKLLKLFYIATKQTRRKSLLYRLVSLVSITVLIMHWTTCICRFIASTYPENVDKWLDISDFSTLTPSSQYIRCLFWTFMTLTGFGITAPTNNPQAIFTILCVSSGVLLYLYLVGNVVGSLAHLQERYSSHQVEMDVLQDYMCSFNIPQELQNSVVEHKEYEFQISKLKGNSHTQNLMKMPLYLRRKVIACISKDIVLNVPFFKDFDDAFLTYLVPLLEYMFILPNNAIIQQGEVGREMYFIASGEVDIIIETAGGEKKWVAENSSGGFFGETALLESSKRTASVISRTLCELFVLKTEDFLECCEQFPQMKEKVKTKSAFYHSNSKTAKPRKTRNSKYEKARAKFSFS